MQASDSRQRIVKKWSALTVATVLVVFYFMLYEFPIFPETITDTLTVGMTSFAALTAALIATRVWRSYAPTTPPRRIWLMYGLALWGWTIAEFVFSYEYFSDGSYLFGPADIFWVGSYALFVMALYYQFGLIYRPNKVRAALAFSIANLLALVLAFIFAGWLARVNARPLDGEVLVNGFYVVGDFCVAGAALWLAFTFRDGALGRPWFGLLVFAFADLAYALLEIGGTYTRSFSDSNFLITLTDSLYFAAYLALAFGCYLHSLLLQYGPSSKK